MLGPEPGPTSTIVGQQSVRFPKQHPSFNSTSACLPAADRSGEVMLQVLGAYSPFPSTLPEARKRLYCKQLDSAAGALMARQSSLKRRCKLMAGLPATAAQAAPQVWSTLPGAQTCPVRSVVGLK